MSRCSLFVVLFGTFSFSGTSNDEFILHSIFTNLVQRAVWVIPDWAAAFESEAWENVWTDDSMVAE